MKNNNKGFSIIFAMGMAVISTLIVIYILEYMIPFSKNVKGIENSTAAFYNAFSAVEDSLYYISNNSIGSESSTVLPGGAVGNSFQIVANSLTLPYSGHGNSEFDKDWSRVRLGEPVQISLPNNISGAGWNTFGIMVRVPNFDYNSSTTETFEANGKDIVNWQLTGTGDTLNSEANNRIKSSDILSSTSTTPSFLFRFKNGKPLSSATSTTFETFYNNNCYLKTNYSCTLKISVIDSLVTNSGKNIPYLEYKFVSGVASLPSNVIRINVKGKSYGFQKEFDIYSPRDTLIEAYDFTVFQ